MRTKRWETANILALLGLIVAVVAIPSAIFEENIRCAVLSDCAASQTHVERAKYRVLIHISNEAQRAEATALKRKLSEAGYNVAPTIDNVGAKSPNNSDVRYFYADDLEAAKDLKKLSETGILGDIGINPRFNEVPKPKSRSLLLYFPA